MPTSVPRVKGIERRPAPSVTPVSVAGVPAGPNTWVNATVAPCTGLPSESVTLTTSGCGSARATVSLCPLPDTMAIALAAPAVPRTVNEMGEPVSAPGALARTVTVPSTVGVTVIRA